MGLAGGFVWAPVVAVADAVEVVIDCVGASGTTIVVGATETTVVVEGVVAVGAGLVLVAVGVVEAGLRLDLAGISGFSVDGVGTGRGTGDGGGTSGC